MISEQASDQPDVLLDSGGLSDSASDDDAIANVDESHLPPHLQIVKPRPSYKKKRTLYNPNKSFVSSPTDLQLDHHLINPALPVQPSQKPDQITKRNSREEVFIAKRKEFLSKSSQLPPHVTPHLQNEKKDDLYKVKPSYKKNRKLYNGFANKIFVSSPTEHKEPSNQVNFSDDCGTGDSNLTNIGNHCSLIGEKEKLENTPISWLPIELLERAFQYLNLIDLSNVTQVSQEGWWVNAWKTLMIWSETSLTMKGEKSLALRLHLLLEHFTSLGKLVLDGLTDQQLDLILGKVTEHNSLKELELRTDFLVSLPSPLLMAKAFHKMKKCSISYGILHRQHVAAIFHQRDTNLESLEVDLYDMSWVDQAKFTSFVLKLQKFHLSCTSSLKLNALFNGIRKSQELKLQDLKITASLGNESPETMADSVVKLNTVDLRTITDAQASSILTRIAEMGETSLRNLTIEWCKHSESRHIEVSPEVMAKAVNKLVRVELFGQLTIDQFISILILSTTQTKLEYLKIRKPRTLNFTRLIREARRNIKTLIIYT